MVNGERVHVCIYENDVVFHEKMEDLVIVILSTWKINMSFGNCHIIVIIAIITAIITAIIAYSWCGHPLIIH